MLAAAGRIARSVSAPVTVDFERGYGLGRPSSSSGSPKPARPA